MSLREQTESIALSHFESAKDTLSRLDRAGIKVFDAYPIITLSEGHVQLFSKFKTKEQARVVAKGYYDTIAKRISSNVNGNGRLKETSGRLQKFYLSGIWQSSDDVLV